MAELYLSTTDLKFYTFNYKEIEKKKFVLNYRNMKVIIKKEFSLDEELSDRILNKVFYQMKLPIDSGSLDQSGFNLTLKLIQALQNGFNLDEPNLIQQKFIIRLKIQKKSKRSKKHLEKIDETILQNEISQNLDEEEQNLEYSRIMSQQIKDQTLKREDSFEQQQVQEIVGVKEVQSEIFLQQEAKVTSFNYFKESFVSGYYQCQIVLNSETKVERRYSDFIMLQDYLAVTYMSQILPQLPKKFSLASNVYKMFVAPTEDLESRRKSLEEYLNFLLKNQVIMRDKILHKFLTIKRKFEDILIEYQQKKLISSSVDFVDVEENVPNPSNYYMHMKIINAVKKIGDTGFNDIKEKLLGGYFSKNPTLDTKFREEFKLTFQYNQTLRVKYNDILMLDKSIQKFYSYNNAAIIDNAKEFVADDIIDEKIYQINFDILSNFGQIKLFEKQSFYNLKQLSSELIKKLEFTLYSYENLEASIYKWYAEREKTCTPQQSNQQKEKNEKGEQHYAQIIEELNINLKMIIDEYKVHVAKILLAFTEELTKTMVQMNQKL